MHGGAQSVYPVTVGALAEAELWVLSDRVDEASRLLLDAEINDTLEPLERQGPASARGPAFELRIIAVAVGLVLLALWILRLVSVY